MVVEPMGFVGPAKACLGEFVPRDGLIVYPRFEEFVAPLAFVQ
jgi:hypothetical protein